MILDEFYADTATGELLGVIEVVDGPLGRFAGDQSGSREATGDATAPSPCCSNDLWNDPMALWSVHEERPDLVQKYTAFLEAQFEAHQLLGSSSRQARTRH